MAFLSKSSDSHSKKGGVSQSTSLQNLPLQTKLRVGRPHDAFEQEADRVADRVVNSPSPKSLTSPASPVAGQISRYVQKQAQEDEQKTVQKQAKPEEDKEAVQKQTKPEEDKEAVQKQTKPEEDKEAVQKQTKPEEDKEAVQKQTKPEEDKEAVQKQTKPEEEQPDQPKVGGELNDPEVEQRLMASKTGGEPLEPDVLQDMEQRFNTSLSHVRIHRDGTAIDLCNRLNAEAFTHGSHIYFNAGKYNPTSAEGKRLLAHELTHVVQQSDRIEREIIQRANGGSSTSGSSQDDGVMDEAAHTLTFNQLLIPPFKAALPEYQGRLVRPKAYARRVELGKSQRDWKTAFGEQSSSVVRPILEQKIRDHAYGNRPGGSQETAIVRSEGIYAFNAPGTASARRRVIGTLQQIIIEFSSPTWNQQGRPTIFNVDHIKELQLGGNDVTTNMFLLRADVNQRSGFSINNRINESVRRHLRSKGEEASNANRDRILTEFDIVFEQAPPDPGFSVGSFDPASDIWKPSDITPGKHFQVSNINQLIEVQDISQLGDARNYLLFPDQSGWIGKQFRNGSTVYAAERAWLAPWEIDAKQTEKIGDEDVLSGLSIKLDERSVTGRSRIHYIPQPPTPIPITRYEGATYAGYINKNQIVQQGLNLRVLSPISFTSIELSTDGLAAQGQVMPTVPLIRDIGLDLSLQNGDVTISKRFAGGDIRVPRPFSIRDSSLTLFASTERGLGIEGRANFGIENVGEGFIGAATSTSGGFELEGEFNFDSQLFDPAKVNVTYRNDTFGITGELGIPQGKVRGIKSANITVAYTEGTFTANGRAELDIRGVESGTLSATYSAQGWSIGGTFNLSGDIPRIRSGSVSVTVQKVAGEEGYRLTATGTAVPDIPGITSQLTIGYDNGILTIEGQASYSRGLLSGEITVGATNRAVGADGQPTGDPTDRFILYGGGSLTIRITPWLQGTVGVRFQPNGEMIVSGRIGLPSSIEVFRRFGIPEREVFGIGFDIPIFAIPVGPRSIGLVASIRGGLRVYAGIGPGRLERLELGVEYNPAHPEETHVTGGGRFVIPAEAGLRLFVRATIGLSAVIGGVEGGLELAGGLGLEAAAEADVNVDWTPQTGLELNASLSAYVQPKFIFTIDGLIRAWFAFYEKEWRWRLANYEYGPDLRFGVRLPIHYREGEPFDISFDNLEITRPNIDASSFLGGLIRDIRERRG